ncbi:unnamed protein product [Amoebophrya sp. A120]|nr:unnamed protein product [Amoebophrya sp. A120]|eukprot:GSA120T00000200001.1
MFSSFAVDKNSRTTTTCKLQGRPPARIKTPSRSTSSRSSLAAPSRVSSLVRTFSGICCLPQTFSLLGPAFTVLAAAQATSAADSSASREMPSGKSLMGDPDMEIQSFDSLADSFKVSLVRPPDEPKNSGVKSIVNMSSMVMLSDEELKTLDDYDELFEKYSMFCNGRWLGVQVLQDSQDLMYMQHIVYMRKPDLIIETGTYKGGLTFFFATLLDMIAKEEESNALVAGTPHTPRPSAVISVDKHHPHMVFAANWFCPVCLDCRRSYDTREWHERVRFVMGLADTDETHNEVLAHMMEIGYDFQREAGPAVAGSAVKDKVVVVNLDANHEYQGLLKELIYYAPYVSLNSYLIVQDAKLDKIWGVPAVSSAVERFLQLLPPFEFVIEHEIKFHGYSQHLYLRRASKTISWDYFAKMFQVNVTSAAASGGTQEEL